MKTVKTTATTEKLQNCELPTGNRKTLNLASNVSGSGNVVKPVHNNKSNNNGYNKIKTTATAAQSNTQFNFISFTLLLAAVAIRQRAWLWGFWPSLSLVHLLLPFLCVGCSCPAPRLVWMARIVWIASPSPIHPAHCSPLLERQQLMNGKSSQLLTYFPASSCCAFLRFFALFLVRVSTYFLFLWIGVKMLWEQMVVNFCTYFC